MRDEGVIKFECRWQKTPPLPKASLQDLLHFRHDLYQRGLIGVYPDGIGYGNLSCRWTDKHQFVISGSQTGHRVQAGVEHFTLVTDYDAAHNRIDCQGPLRASSESLTHAAIYETFPEANAVIHVHSPALWQTLKGHVPATSADIPYGTPQMAQEIKRLSAETNLKECRIFVMAGHEDGVVTFGKDLAEAHRILLQHL